jgi:hypothetical protein
MRNLILLFGLMIMSGAGWSATINVPDDQPNIQAGIDVASEGDTVLVAPGSYDGKGNLHINFGGKNLMLSSESGPHLTTIRGITFASSEDSTSVVRGFKIQSGLHCFGSSPYILDNIIEQSGIYLSNSNSRIEDCTIRYMSPPPLGEGPPNPGVTCNNSTVTIINCVISDNTGEWFYTGGGGGMVCIGSTVDIYGTIFYNNWGGGDCGDIPEWHCSAGSGGSILCSGTNLSIENCSFIGNSAAFMDATGKGGAIWASVEGGTSVRIEKSIFHENRGNGAIYIEGEGASIDIICNDFSPENSMVIESADQAHLEDNIFMDPLFCDETNRDFHLNTLSPCQPRHNSCRVLIGALGIGCGPMMEAVELDIKPGSCPNPLNVPKKDKGHAVLPVAILGTGDFDVRKIVPESIILNGVSPLRWSYEDLSTPADKVDDSCSCTEDGADGYEDLTVKFDRESIIASLNIALTDEEATVTAAAKKNIQLENNVSSTVGHEGASDRDSYVLRVEGLLDDGSTFEGYDCVTLNAKDEMVMKPLDLTPGEVELYTNSPNPFNPVTRIGFYLPEAKDVRLEVYNVLGQRVDVVVEQHMEPGNYTVEWDASDYASGVYFYRFVAGDYWKTKKMLLLK